MITVLVQFTLPAPLTRGAAKAIFLETAPKYRDIQGLIRKYYVLSEDGTTAGGVYLWSSRADAEALYTESWREFVGEKYGCAPSVTFFDSPVVVDNRTGEILAD